MLIDARADHVAVINGDLTPIATSIQGATSNRYQEHMWMTDDGGVHLLIAGLDDSVSGLRILSTHDAGTSWMTTLQLAETQERPKADALFQDGELHLVYPGVAGELMYARFVRSSHGQWQQQVQHRLFDAHETHLAQRPTLTLDQNGHVWVAFTQTDLATGQIVMRVGVLNESGRFRLIERVFGTANHSERKSARIHALNAGLVLIYTDGPDDTQAFYTLNISYCASVQDHASWIDQALLTYPEHDGFKDRYGAHFNALIDNISQVQIVTTSEGTLLHVRWHTSNPAAPVLQRLGNSNPYVQIAHSSDGTLYIAGCFDPGHYKDVVKLLRSADGGASFVPERYLVYEPEINLGKARIEMPLQINLTSGQLPLVRQIERPDGLYGFVAFF